MKLYIIFIVYLLNSLERLIEGSVLLAGVAASFAMAGMGTDTGNSIRGPSGWTSNVGIRASLGLSSR